jgi:hexosaminidase
MIYPRLLAVAELTWTPKEDKNIHRFEQSMYANYHLFNLWNLNARLPNVSGLEDVVTNKYDYAQTLTYPLQNAAVQYTLNGTLPDTAAATGSFPLTINSPLKDSLAIAVYTTRPLSKRILQKVLIKHINLKLSATDGANLQPGLSYMMYKTTYNNVPTTDTTKDFEIGVLRKDGGLNPYPGLFNSWVKVYGYLKIDREGDYHISSDFENTPMLLMGTTVILDGTKNKYIDPQAAILHLQKGIYQLSGYYLADKVNSRQTLIRITTTGGKQIDADSYLFH